MTADIQAAFEAQAAAGLGGYQDAPGGPPSPPEGDSGGGVGLSVLAGLSASLGRLASALEAQRQWEQAQAQDIWVEDLPAAVMTLSGGAGTLDIPNQLGPNTGYAWAVHWVAAAGFSAGTVSLYLGGSADTVAGSNQRFAFTSAGVWEPPRTATILQPGTRMIFVASGITGNVVISGQVTQMKLHMLPKFLL